MPRLPVPRSRAWSICLLWLALLLAPLAWAQSAPGPAPAKPHLVAPAGADLPVIQPAAVANPYGLRALWAQGDWVARATLVILVISCRPGKVAVGSPGELSSTR